MVAVVSDFYQYLALNVVTTIALHVRDVGGLVICIMGGSVLCFCTRNCGQWNPVLCWPFCSYFVCFCHLRSLVMMIPRSRCWSVISNYWFDMFLVVLPVVVFDVHHRTFIYIESNLPLFTHSTSLLISSCSSIMPSGFLVLWQSLVSSANLDILLTIFVSWSFIYIRNNSRPNTLPCGTPDVTGAQLL